MEILLKRINQSLAPADEEAANFIFNTPQGQIVKAKITKPRNLDFHRKYFALLDHAYDAWEPEIPEQWQGHDIEKNKETFRKNIQILAGYGYPVINLKNEVRYESKSIKFGKMKQEEFEQLYSSVINVILKHILKNHDRADIDRIVEEILRFA